MNTPVREGETIEGSRTNYHAEPTLSSAQVLKCVFLCEPVCVCVSLVRVVIICPASTHTALVSSPSLTVVHLSTYIQGVDGAH